MIIVGHRGARHEAPENTVEGFTYAQANGCQHFELDIQLSSDFELMVFHDDTLVRTTGTRGKLARFDSQTLKKLDARRNTPRWATPCTIPSLQDVINNAPHAQHWQFEVKTDSRHRLGNLAIKLDSFIAINALKDRVTVTSSDRWFLQLMQRQNKTIELGYVAEWRLPNPVETATKLGCSYLCLNASLATAKRIAAAKAHNMHVSVWTVNDKNKMKELEQIGVDSIITDTPTLALNVFNNK